jgi:hypothetical protein
MRMMIQPPEVVAAAAVGDVAVFLPLWLLWLLSLMMIMMSLLLLMRLWRMLYMMLMWRIFLIKVGPKEFVSTPLPKRDRRYSTPERRVSEVP